MSVTQLSRRVTNCTAYLFNTDCNVNYVSSFLYLYTDFDCKAFLDAERRLSPGF